MFASRSSLDTRSNRPVEFTRPRSRYSIACGTNAARRDRRIGLEEIMSFVITTCSPELVVQVSETRHSDIETKRVISEDLRKTLIVKGRQTHFVLGWVGLASTPFGHHTTNWLFKALR